VPPYFVVVANMKDSLKDKFIFVGCHAYNLNNCLQHGIGTLDLDIQLVVLETCNY
jgi:hypothetical protein